MRFPRPKKTPALPFRTAQAMGHRILHLAKTTRGSRDARAFRARRDYKLAWRELDFFERATVALIVTEYDRDPGSNYADEQLK